MGWATEAIREIREGRTARVRPRGGSMRRRIEDGQLVTLAPVDARDVEVGDAVLVRWKGGFLLHLIKRIVFLEDHFPTVGLDHLTGVRVEQVRPHVVG